MSKEKTFKDLDKLCRENPNDISLKFRSIVKSLEDLKLIYSHYNDSESLGKINERFFSEFDQHFSGFNRDPGELINKLEIIRLSLEPEGGGDFIELYEKLTPELKEKLVSNQSSSVAIINYISAPFGLSGERGARFILSLRKFENWYGNIEFIIAFPLFFILWLGPLAFVDHLFGPSPGWVKGGFYLFCSFLSPFILIKVFDKVGTFLRKKSGAKVIERLKEYHEKHSQNENTEE